MREIMLIVHFIGLAMGLGTGVGFIFLGIAASKMEMPERKKFMLNAFALSQMGKIGLVLLILSGGYLITPYWKSLSSMPTLIAKLLLVLLLIIMIIVNTTMMGKAKKGEDKYLAKIPVLGRFTLLTVLAIIALAVYTFH